MQHTFKRLAIAAAAASALAAPAAQAQEFHGYLRTGVGTTSEGGDQKCFDSRNFGAGSKYRLGNECETYGELAAALPFGKSDGAWAKFNVMLAFVENNGQGDYESVNGGKYDIASRQNWMQAGGFFARGGAFEDAKIWVGKRYYNRHDVHITDYFYWNNSGLGTGIEDINTGPAKLAFAYHQNGNGNNTLSTRRLSARAYDIAVNPNGKLEGELVYLTGSTADKSVTAPKEGSGYALMLEHTQSAVLGGYNKFAFVYGKDDAAGGAFLPTYANADDSRKGVKEFRFIEQLYFDLTGTGWSGMATAVYSQVKIPLASGKGTWLSIGARPQYNFSPNVSVAIEAGYDQVKVTCNVCNSATAKLAKLTVAPQYTLSGGFWARPAFRAFATYAKWNDEAAAANIADGAFGTKKNGMSYGVQVEAWW